MKNFLCCFLLMLGVMGALPAQNHFLYIQSENRQPFSVSLNNKSYNSTSSGYVIIPKLNSGEYDFTVKFPNKDVQESKFNVVIEKKDIGFSLNAANSTAAITNMQTFITQRAGEKPLYASNKIDASSPKTSILENVLAKLKKGVNKIFEIQGSQGVSLRYVDVQDKKVDTIDIVIPVSRTLSKADIQAALAKRKKELAAVPERVESGIELMAVRQEGYNTNCVNLASGEDYFRLRKKMASETSVDKMIAEAKKAARNKCFTTVQIKNLAALFITDEGRYKFFSAVYPLVYDYIQFPSLEKELAETSYIEKFRAILHK